MKIIELDKQPQQNQSKPICIDEKFNFHHAEKVDTLYQFYKFLIVIVGIMLVGSLMLVIDGSIMNVRSRSFLIVFQWYAVVAVFIIGVLLVIAFYLVRAIRGMKDEVSVYRYLLTNAQIIFSAYEKEILSLFSYHGQGMSFEQDIKVEKGLEKNLVEQWLISKNQDLAAKIHPIIRAYGHTFVPDASYFDAQARAICALAL
jgi:hypothetical protein